MGCVTLGITPVHTMPAPGTGGAAVDEPVWAVTVAPRAASCHVRGWQQSGRFLVCPVGNSC